jgi:hypothetical protein
VTISARDLSFALKYEFEFSIRQLVVDIPQLMEVVERHLRVGVVELFNELMKLCSGAHS